MNEFEIWLKKSNSDENQQQPDSNQTYAAVHRRIIKRHRRRQAGYGLTAIAAVLTIAFMFSGDPARPDTNGSLTGFDQEAMFQDALVTAMMDSSELNSLYWSSIAYLVDDADPIQPLLDINLSEADLQAFATYLEEQNS